MPPGPPVLHSTLQMTTASFDPRPCLISLFSCHHIAPGCVCRSSCSPQCCDCFIKRLNRARAKLKCLILQSRVTRCQRPAVVCEHACVDSETLIDGRTLGSLTLVNQHGWDQLEALTTTSSTDKAKAVFASSTIRFMLRGLKEKVPCAFLDMCTSTGCNPASTENMWGQACRPSPRGSP